MPGSCVHGRRHPTVGSWVAWQARKHLSLRLCRNQSPFTDLLRSHVAEQKPISISRMGKLKRKTLFCQPEKNDQCGQVVLSKREECVCVCVYVLVRAHWGRDRFSWQGCHSGIFWWIEFRAQQFLSYPLTHKCIRFLHEVKRWMKWSDALRAGVPS